MKKKFLNFTLFGVFVLALSLSVVGCKDYDDDIKNLQGQIDSQNSALTSKITSIEATIAQLTAKDTELKSEITALQGQIKAATDETTRLHAEALAAVATAKAEAIAAAKTDLEAAKTELKGLITAQLDAAKSELKDLISAQGTRLTAVESSLATLVGRLDAIDGSIADISGLRNEVAGLKGAVTTLETQLADMLVQYGLYKESVAIQLAALNAYKESSGADIEDAKVALANAEVALEDALSRIEALESNTDLVAIREVLDGVDFEQLKNLVNSVNEALNVMANNINAMITSVRIVSTDYNGEIRDYISMGDYNESNMSFNLARAITDFDFGYSKGYENGFVSISTPYENGFKFVKDQEQGENKARSKVIIQVSPANVNLTVNDLDRISLIDTKGSTAVNNLMKAVDINKFNETLTRSLPTQTGLYEVTFELTNSAITSHKDVTYTGTTYASSKKVLFAVAVENKVDGASADRHVLSTFGVTATMIDRASIYDMDFNVDDTNVSRLKNRFFSYTSASSYYGLLDYRWKASASAHTANTSTTYIEVDSPDDVRGGKDLFYVDINTTFKISFPAAKKPYAYYVVLDRGGIGLAEDEAVSENNAWNQYAFTGLKKVVYGDQKLELSVNSEIARGDIIGFRVIAINADGTLVDPDGKAFYVYCGKVETVKGIDFVMTFADYFPTATPEMSQRPFTYTPSSKITSGVLNLSIGTTAAPVSIPAADLVFYTTATGSTVVASPLTDPTKWASVRSATLKDVNPMNLEDGRTYTGSIDLYMTVTSGPGTGQQIKVATIPVTVKKTLPTKFIPTLEFKTGQGENKLLIAYPVPNSAKTQGTYNFKNGFAYFVNSVAQSELKEHIQFGQDGTSPSVLVFNNNVVSQNVVVDAAKVGKQSQPDGKPANYTTGAYYSYGAISTVKNPYIVGWSNNNFNLEFHSYMEDSKYDWLSSQQIVFNVDGQYINLSQIEVTPPYGTKFNNLGWSGFINRSINDTSDGTRYTDIIEAEMAIKSIDGEYKVGEYFTINVNKTNNRLVFVKNADNSQSAPSTDLDAVIRLTFVDDFGHNVKVEIDGTFVMKRAQ